MFICYCCLFATFLVASVTASVYFLFKIKSICKNKFYFSATRWDKTSNNVVILHRLEPGKCIPCPCPFTMKLETYLRIAEIPYQIDTEDSFGPTGRSPWITYNGIHIGDSQLIIEFLNKTFQKNLSEKLSHREKAIARSVRIVVEEHLYWGFADWLWVTGYEYIGKVLSYSRIFIAFLGLVVPRRVQRAMRCQGLGRHSFEVLSEVILEDLRNIFTLLGENKYLMNNFGPCEEDAALFGMLSILLYACIDSPYQKLMNEKELQNLKEYCTRMKSQYWPDWNDCCANSTGKKK